MRAFPTTWPLLSPLLAPNPHLFHIYDGCTTLNAPKPTEQYTLKGRILQYVNSTSTKKLDDYTTFNGVEK